MCSCAPAVPPIARTQKVPLGMAAPESLMEARLPFVLTHTKIVYDTGIMAEKTSTVNISFREDLLKQIDEVARIESRSRSELVREAARMYIERRRRMDAVIESIRETVRQRGITEEDVAAEVAAVRAERKQRRS